MVFGVQEEVVGFFGGWLRGVAFIGLPPVGDWIIWSYSCNLNGLPVNCGTQNSTTQLQLSLVMGGSIE